MVHHKVMAALLFLVSKMEEQCTNIYNFKREPAGVNGPQDLGDPPTNRRHPFIKNILSVCASVRSAVAA